MFNPQKTINAAATIILLNSAVGAPSMHRMGSAAEGMATSQTSGHVPYHGARPIENSTSMQSTAMKNSFAMAILEGTAESTIFMQTSGSRVLPMGVLSAGKRGAKADRDGAGFKIGLPR